jgi:hypothetical protein
MKLIVRTICLGAVLVACSGCAHYAEGVGNAQASYANARTVTCETNDGERVYRNPFLRERRIGEACGR